MKRKLQKLLEDKGSLSKDQVARFYGEQTKFGNAFVINMANRTERLKQAKKTLDKVGIDFFRFVAIVGKELSNTPYAKQFDVLRPGELGCLLSHLSIAALAADHPVKDNFTLIFEDDIVTSSGQDAIQRAFKELEKIDKKENIQIVYFGKCLESCKKIVHITDNIYRAAAPSCCHAYAIKNSFAERLFKDLDNCGKYESSVLNCSYYNRGIDSIYGDYIINGMVLGLVFHPSIFYQDVLSDGGSDLRDEYMLNYQECNDTNPCHYDGPSDENVYIHENKKGRIGYILTIVVLSLIVIIFLVIWQRKSVKKAIRSKASRWIIGMLSGLFVVLLTVLLLWEKIRKQRENAPPDWLKDFEPPPYDPLVSIRDFCYGHQEEFIFDTRMLANREYDVFNPNGILVSIDSFPGSFQKDPEYNMLMTSRCSNGKVSYPLMQIFDFKLKKLQYSKIILVNSHVAMKSKNMLGYEDMRVFMYGKDIYLIGVNLDRTENNLPSMVLVKLDQSFETAQTWHLRYRPLINFPNKNWSPIILPNGELGFIVDIDPLLIVSRRSQGDKLSEVCDVAYQEEKQTSTKKVRNSTITYGWHNVPHEFKMVFNRIFGKCPNGHQRYILMGHTKYVEGEFISEGWKVIYQHYFAVIDLSLNLGKYKSKVHLSNPFYVEENEKPHIEYISGMSFYPKTSRYPCQLVIMYGLHDKKSKFIRLNPEGLVKLLTSKAVVK